MNFHGFKFFYFTEFSYFSTQNFTPLAKYFLNSNFHWIFFHKFYYFSQQNFSFSQKKISHTKKTIFHYYFPPLRFSNGTTRSKRYFTWKDRGVNERKSDSEKNLAIFSLSFFSLTQFHNFSQQYSFSHLLNYKKKKKIICRFVDVCKWLGCWTDDGKSRM